jgi:NadR type nicotinamide-nucleotide adenylyltransferase
MENPLAQQASDCIKIVLFGPESTGKTTLSNQLANHYKTVWAEEFARDYLQEKWNRTHVICELSDILPIARGQMALENKLAVQANRVLICDTDLLETQVYSEAYYGTCPPELEIAAKANTYDLYLLTYIDVPWAPDDLRDRPNQRAEMFRYFEEALKKSKKPYVLLKGSKTVRLKKAIFEIDKLLKSKKI